MIDSLENLRQNFTEPISRKAKVKREQAKVKAENDGPSNQSLDPKTFARGASLSGWVHHARPTVVIE